MPRYDAELDKVARYLWHLAVNKEGVWDVGALRFYDAARDEVNQYICATDAVTRSERFDAAVGYLHILYQWSNSLHRTLHSILRQSSNLHGSLTLRRQQDMVVREIVDCFGQALHRMYTLMEEEQCRNTQPTTTASVRSKKQKIASEH